MKRMINVFEHADEITGALAKSGVLLTSKNNGRTDTMTIGWGMLGIIWGVPAFTCYVREGRFTREQIDGSGEFTVNIPCGSFDKKILGFCGSRSGRNVDKISELGLTLVNPDEISTPGIKELPLTLECKVLYRQLQNKDAIPAYIQKSMYPEDIDSSDPMANRDYHVEYIGQILRAYIIEND